MRKTLNHHQIQFLDGLVETYGDVLLKYASRYLHYQPSLLPMAQDAVQETYLKAVRHVDALMEHPNPGGWLIVSLRNVLQYMLREEGKRPEDLVADVSAVPGVASQNIIEAMDRWSQQRLPDVLNAAACVLTEDERETFYRHFVEGYTTEETAVLQGVSKDTIRGRIYQIRMKLKKYFQMLCALTVVLHYYK